MQLAEDSFPPRAPTIGAAAALLKAVGSTCPGGHRSYQCFSARFK